MLKTEEASKIAISQKDFWILKTTKKMRAEKTRDKWDMGEKDRDRRGKIHLAVPEAKSTARLFTNMSQSLLLITDTVKADKHVCNFLSVYSYKQVHTAHS